MHTASMLLIAATSCAAGALLSVPVRAQTLSAYAVNQGFTLGPWGYAFTTGGGPNGDIGPLGILPRMDGKVLVSSFDSKLRLYALNTPIGDPTGQPESPNGSVTADYGPATFNALGIGALVTSSGVRYFLCQNTLGKVIEIDADGVYMQDIALIPGAFGICAFPPAASHPGTSVHLGHLFVTTRNGIYEIDPAFPGASPALFATAGADGITFTSSGQYLLTNTFAVIDVLTGAVVYTVQLPGADGVAIGRGSLMGGKAYVNCTTGDLWEVVYDQAPGVGLELDPPTTPIVTSIFSGGSRGDFIAVDPFRLSGGPVTYYPSLLVTQSAGILRLDPPDDGWFGPPFVTEVQVSAMQSSCFGDGTGPACPCGNVGAATHGCDNSGGTGGARLTLTGSTLPDTMTLTSTEELPTAATIFLQSTSIFGTSSGVIFGDGVRCLSGALLRLYVKSASGGTVTAPASGDPSMSARSAALGSPLSPGSVTYHQAYYRDPDVSFCPDPPVNTWNISNAVRIDW